jgi:hypothetical protein
MYACACVRAYMYVCMYGIVKHVCMCACVSLCMCACVHAFVCMCVHPSMHACTCACMQVCMYASMQVCMLVPTHMSRMPSGSCVHPYIFKLTMTRKAYIIGKKETDRHDKTATSHKFILLRKYIHTERGPRKHT